jgi:hypothetical protein
MSLRMSHTLAHLKGYDWSGDEMGIIHNIRTPAHSVFENVYATSLPPSPHINDEKDIENSSKMKC